MVACKNPECVKGLNPGVVIVGAGDKGRPVVGEGSRPPNYRWGWTRCLMCNADDTSKKNGVTFKAVNRSLEEIAQRRELANNKSPYKPESTVAKSLGSIRGQQNHNPQRVSGTLSPTIGATEQSAQINRLLEVNSKLAEQVSKLSTQISELLDDNRALRKALDGYAAARSHVTDGVPT